MYHAQSLVGNHAFGVGGFLLGERGFSSNRPDAGVTELALREQVDIGGAVDTPRRARHHHG